MAESTLVNGQVTDAITQTNIKNLGNAPDQTIAVDSQIAAQSVGLAMQNAVANQQNMSASDTSVATLGVNPIHSIPVAAETRGTNGIVSPDAVAEELADLKAAARMAADR